MTPVLRSEVPVARVMESVAETRATPSLDAGEAHTRAIVSPSPPSGSPTRSPLHFHRRATEVSGDRVDEIVTRFFSVSLS